MIPKNAKKVPLRPVALGEATGHHHSLMADPGVVLDDVAEIYEEAKADGSFDTYLRVLGEGVRLVHQEHKASVVAPGEYKVTIQREESDWGAQPVRD